MNETKRPRPKMTLSEIARDLGFTTRQGIHERGDRDYLIFSLQPFRNTLKRVHKFDIDNPPLRKPLPYSVIKLIYKQLG
jgi:hypothetical protein